MPAYTNAKQTLPLIFQEIMRNQAERAALAAPAVIPFDAVKHHATLVVEMEGFRRDAERALKWNTDKGNPA